MKKHNLPAVPFFFLRHAETDHNVYRIFDDINEPSLNEKGVRQAEQLKERSCSLEIKTICTSPLKRVQQTRELIHHRIGIEDQVIEELRECPSQLWRAFLSWEERELTLEEWDQVNRFVDQVHKGLEKALQYEAPVLIIAHGGTYWALAHLLNLPGPRKIDNCRLVKISPNQEIWSVDEPFLS